MGFRREAGVTRTDGTRHHSCWTTLSAKELVSIDRGWSDRGCRRGPPRRAPGTFRRWGAADRGRVPARVVGEKAGCIQRLTATRRTAGSAAARLLVPAITVRLRE